MAQAETRYLQVNGAKLCFDVVGSGPHIIFVAGANGNAGIFYPAREHLKSHFTIVTYDRRGFSRSELTSEQDYTSRIDTDVDDIYQIMKSLTSEKFTICGSSSGGVVALRYLCTHPETLSKALTHEPPLLSIMPEKEELKQFAIDIYELYKKEGRDVAMIKFGDFYCNENDKQMMRFSQGEADPERVKNSDYWFEHELWKYPTTEFDWGRVKTCSQDKLIPVCGVENKGFFLYKPNALLAELTGTEIFIVPGGHFGYLTHAEQFAKEITEKLKTEHVI